MRDRTGQQVGNYHVIRLLEQGTVIDRYLSYDVTSQRQITLFLLAVPTDEAGIFRFQRNLPIIKRLVHPHIAPLLDTGVQGMTPFVALDPLPTSRQSRRFPLPISTVIQYVSQLADAFDYAHSHYASPSSIAPETILIGHQGEALFAGFGVGLLEISHHPGGNDTPWDFPVPLCYLSPEQVSGRPIGPFSDQYALAAVVYEWLCGVPLFQGSEPLKIVLQIIQAPPPSLQEKARMLPRAVEQVIVKALAKKPEERFATIKAFSNALVEASQKALDSPTRPT
jgi:serine/threonine protein kinase